MEALLIDIHMHHEYLYLNIQMEMLYSFLLKYLGWDLLSFL